MKTSKDLIVGFHEVEEPLCRDAVWAFGGARAPLDVLAEIRSFERSELRDCIGLTKSSIVRHVEFVSQRQSFGNKKAFTSDRG